MESTSMKMHSPGQSSSSVNHGRLELGGHADDPLGLTRIVEDPIVVSDIGDAVLEQDEDLGTVVDAEAVTGAQVLVDPYPHDTDEATGPASAPGSDERPRPGQRPGGQARARAASISSTASAARHR